MKKIIIIGAGPCGIGAGWYLNEKGYHAFSIYEKNSYAGGLSASFKDKAGFVWDIGGHVLFSKSRIFNKFVRDVMGKNIFAHQRRACVHVKGRSIPYPLQNHLHLLPADDYRLCLEGLHSRPNAILSDLNFNDWLINYFGDYLAREFLIPLNKKMWGCSLKKLSTQWIKNRVSPLKLEKISRPGGSRNNPDRWGPNYRFLYPKEGGIGQLFSAACQNFKSKVKFGFNLIGIDGQKKILRFENGLKVSYDTLIYSGDIRDLVGMISPRNETMINLAKKLISNKIIVLGIGLKKSGTDNRSWIYFPERQYPFFRLTNLSNYSKNNVPGADINRYSSLLIELGFPSGSNSASALSIRNVIEGLFRAGFIKNKNEDALISTFTYETERAYPMPTLQRDAILNQLQGYLEQYQILSRGRFGAFRYEHGNMDDCFMQGYTSAQESLHL